MLTKRIIPCLDVKGGQVVKGVQFRDHVVMGDPVELARRYRDEGADELVFYDISASCTGRFVERKWIGRLARVIDIPFCVAGGIRSVAAAREVLWSGADKISVNSPALERPDLIDELADTFGRQCVVVGIDSKCEAGEYLVHQYTGDVAKTIRTTRTTLAWAQEAQRRGAGELVVNCMNRDGMRDGYDLEHLHALRSHLTLPLIASGGAGRPEHFFEVFSETGVNGALAAGVFHSGQIVIAELKRFLADQGVRVRPC